MLHGLAIFIGVSPTNDSNIGAQHVPVTTLVPGGVAATLSTG